MRLLIAIINWNTREQLRRCLRSLEPQLGELDAEAVVIDNASTDGSAAMVADEFPWARLLASPRNLGFAGGVNAAIRSAESDYHLILNPDVEPGPDAIATLLRLLDEHPDAAAAAPVLTDADGRPQAHLYRRFPTLPQLLFFWTALGVLGRRVPALRRRWFEHDLRVARPTPADQLPGAAMLVRRAVWREIGAFDPDYFIWFEDVDWCYRARRGGHALYIHPGARMRHEGGASFRAWSLSTRVHQFYRAFARFLCKHRLDRLRRWGMPLLLADLVLKDAVLRGARLLGWRGGSGGASLHAARDGVRQVIRHHRRGQLMRFVDAEIDGVRAPAGGADRTAPAAPAAPVHDTPPARDASTNEAPAAAPGVPASRARPEVDAVIVNWNGLRYLPACIRALREATLPVRIIVVDNASTDGSAGYVRAELPEAELVALDANLGYAAGANAGLSRGAAEYAIVLNPDVVLAPDHLARLSDRLDADPRIGAAQGKLYRLTPGALDAGELRPGGELDSAGHVIRRSRMVVDRGQGQPDGPAFDREVSVFSACGAALFLRRAMLEDLGAGGRYFDESFFAYKEDIDLCWRARLLGWDVRYVPGAIGYHVRGWAGDGPPPKDRIPLAARRHSWKNHYLLMLKNDRPLDVLRGLPAILGWELVRQAYALFRDPALFLAYADLARALPAALGSRRAVMRRCRAARAGMRRWFSGPAAVARPG